MTSVLAPIINATQIKTTNIDAYNNLIAQFLSDFDLDNENLSLLANDSLFPNFLQQVFDSLLISAFPAPTEGPLPEHLLAILSFLTQISLSHPDILSFVATFTPVDRLINVFFKRNFSNDKLIDIQPSHLLPQLQFLSAISQSSQIVISSTESIHLLFITCSSLLNQPQLSATAISVISGFGRNSSAAQTYFLSLPNLTHFKRDLASLLTSNDHSIMIAALSALTVLFPRSIDKSTSMKVAFSAVISPPTLPVATSLASAIVLQLSDDQEITPQDQEILINAALKSSGMRAFILYRLIDEVASDTKSRAFTLLQQPEFFTRYMTVLIDCDDSFVVVAGTHLLQTVFDEAAPLVINESIEKPFIRALRFLLSSNKKADIEKVESILVVLRILVQSSEALTYLTNILQSNEENIFLAFQRNIESGNAFASLNFFMFLYNSAVFFPHWLLRLREVAVDSVLPALIVQCLSKSQNRRVINDALSATIIITNGIKSKPPAFDMALTDAVSSGFFLINRTNKNQMTQLELKMKEMHDTYEEQIRMVEVERDLSENELKSAREEIENSKTQNDFAQQKIEEVQSNCEILKRHLASKKKKLKMAANELKNSDQEIQNLSIQLSKFEKEASEAQRKSEKLHSKIQALRETEIQFSQLSETAEHTEDELRVLKLKAHNYEEEITELNDTLAQEKAKKNKVDKMLGEAQDRINFQSTEIERIKSEYDALLLKTEKIELVLKGKNSRELELTEEVRKLREEVNDFQRRIAELTAENEHYTELIAVMRSRIENLKKDKKELVVISQMIHKMTNGQIENLSEFKNAVNV